MKTIIFSAVLLFTLTAGYSQSTKWGYDPAHSKIEFSVTHFGIADVTGKFPKFEGTVLSDRPDFSDAKIDFTIDVASIDTEESQRDTHLKSPDFFDVAKYPSIVFKSKSLKSIDKNKYKMIGDFTMHGVTKEITLDVVYRGTVEKNPLGSARAGFKVTGMLKRSEFGLKWNGVLETGGVLVSDEVVLTCAVELMKNQLEVVLGTLLLIGAFVPLVLVVLIPISVNILLFHSFLAPDNSAMRIVIVLVQVFLAWAYRDYFKLLYVRKTAISL